ncbi:hypothetical protein EUX98_g1696 [Antrodiella citrinella]|uniref:E3 ubiquitin protein ligase n=1 Tax=Antrodiella citrinella TaxID=2447956 RepID=A0A4S4N2C2_9APHY|nr:hypothetical protein EUX98_g1696 [Antrodiella citrinella]
MATVESRKRARTEDGEGTRVKKRAVTEERNSPGLINGTVNANPTPSSNDADEPKEHDELEAFRKDAIYRRMKHYSRENERSLVKIAELERRRHTCEAGLAALEACWSQIVDTIRSLVRPEDLPPVDVQSQEIYDLSAHVSQDSDPVYADSLRTKVQATQQLITAFVQLGGKAQAVLSSEEVYTECQRAQTQCSSLHSEVSFMRTRLQTSESEKERLREELVAAHTKIDRLQSKPVATLNAVAQSPSPQTNMNNESGGSEEVKKDEGSSPTPTPSSPSGATPVAVMNGIHAVLESTSEPVQDEATGEVKEMEVEDPDAGRPRDDVAAEWIAVAALREKKVAELQYENVELRAEVQHWKVTAKAPSPEFIQETAVYKHLYDIAREVMLREEGRLRDLNTCKEEMATLSRVKQEWLKELTDHQEKALSEFKTLAEKRTTEAVRLREQRDQLQTEVNERKQKDSLKIASATEFRRLADLRKERIEVLYSEVTRLKARLAAKAGDEDLMTFFFQPTKKDASERAHTDSETQEYVVDQSYVHDLRKRLSTAESRAAALEATLSTLDQEHPDIAPHVRAAAEAKQQVSHLEKRLQAFESVLTSSRREDVMQAMEEKLKTLRLQVEEKTKAEVSMEVELDKLSAAWDNQGKALENKIFDLTAFEEKMQKVVVDRVKLETKFYAAMRDKEAVDLERKNLSRNVEKQGKMIEALHTTEKHLKTRISETESQNALLQKVADKCREAEQKLQEEIGHVRASFEDETKRANATVTWWKEVEHKLNGRTTAVSRSEEHIARSKVEAERLLSKAKEKAEKAVVTSNPNTREATLVAEVEKCMTNDASSSGSAAMLDVQE